MPEDGGHWSALHSWVMPTPSFLEFIMFSRYQSGKNTASNSIKLSPWLNTDFYLLEKLSRMFADSLNSLHTNSSEITTCLLGSSSLEVSLRPCLTGGMNIEELYYPISTTLSWFGCPIIE